jgi:DNA-binding NarL/FixJ family response regulator
MAIEKQPDVVLLDIRMSETDGLAALEQIRAALPETRVVMLSTYDNPTYIARAVALGASDYLLKGVSRPQLLASITAKGPDGVAVRSEPLRRVQGAMETRRTDVDDGVSLTQRESQVLRHMALGLSNKEIGRSLEISVETVKEHVQNILRKLQVNDRTQAAVWAVRHKLV